MPWLEAPVSQVFDWLWQTSWQVALLAAAVLVLERLLRRWLAPAQRMVLWLLVIARCVIPVLPPDPLLTSRSVTPARAPHESAGAETVLTARERTDRPDVTRGEQIALAPHDRDAALSHRDDLLAPTAPTAPVAATSAPSLAAGSLARATGTAPEHGGFSLRRILLTAWLLGFALLLLRMVLRERAFRRRLAGEPRLHDAGLDALLDDCRARLHLRRPVALVASTLVDAPAISGFWRPQLLVPATLDRANHEDLRRVFLHELAHVKRGDPVLNLLLEIVRCAYWFHPAVWLAVAGVRVAQEEARDWDAMAADPRSEPAAYARTLLALAATSNRVQAPLASGLLRGRDRLARRLTTITRFGRIPRSARVLGAMLVVGLAWAGLTRARPAGETTSAGPIAASAARGKVVVLDLEGMDARLTLQLLDEGALTNLARLRTQGTFAALTTVSPADETATAAALLTGCNPGKTNMFGFIRRMLHANDFRAERDAAGRLTNGDAYQRARGILPALGHLDAASAPASALLGFDPREVPALDLPETLPALATPLQARPFWDDLDLAGERTVCLQPSLAIPAKAGPHTRLLAGLGFPDVALTQGTWFMYTSLDFEWNRRTDTGGRVTKIKPRNGTFTTQVFGPEKFLERQRREQLVDALDLAIAKLGKDPAVAAPMATLRKEVESARFELRDWLQKDQFTTAPMVGVIDRDAKTVRLTIGDETQTLREGEWSRFFRPLFTIQDPFFRVRGALRVQFTRCEPDHVRLFMTPISWDPAESWPHLGLSSPPELARDLARELGTFETIGWPCATMAVKDNEIPDQSFMDTVAHVLEWHRSLLEKALSWGDWDVLFQTVGELDAVAHVMYRHLDAEHPAYSSEAASAPLTWLGRTFAARDAIREVYRELDRTVGLVLDRIARGDLGEHAMLLVCSAHGMRSGRRQVELNRLLVEQGQLVLRDDATTPHVMNGVDWSRTKAYALGQGAVYLNLKGREPNGAVEPQAYDRTCDEVIRSLLDYRPRVEGRELEPVVRSARKRSDLYSGDWWREQIDADGYVVKPGAPDILVGLQDGYRVAWETPAGGIGKEVVLPNESTWSGDHASVDADLVPGVLFASVPLERTDGASILDLAPTILALRAVPVPAAMDGRPLAVRR